MSGGGLRYTQEAGPGKQSLEAATAAVKASRAPGTESLPAARPAGQWPAWIDDVLAYAPVAELEAEWRAEIGDAITRALDLRAGTVEVYNCATCGAARYRSPS